MMQNCDGTGNAPPKVSVIVPVYNQGKYLSEALDSVVRQTYPYWECIIVNDGSSDGTEEVAKYYVNQDARFKYLYQENAGVAAARNNGIKHSDGFFILPLDGDDYINSTYLEKAVNYLQFHPETTLVYGKVERFGKEKGLMNLPEYSWDSIIWRNCIVNCAMFKRADFENTRGYDVNMRNHQDWDYWLTLLNPDSVVHCFDEVMLYYRISNNGLRAEGGRRFEAVARQIYNNHKEIYAPYLSDVLYYRSKGLTYEEEYWKVKEKYDGVLSSKAYRLGKVLMKPFAWMKSFK